MQIQPNIFKTFPIVDINKNIDITSIFGQNGQENRFPELTKIQEASQIPQTQIQNSENTENETALKFQKYEKTSLYYDEFK